MKKILLISLLFTACSHNSNNEKAITKAKEAEQKEQMAPKNKYPGVEFAVNKDLSCGMPLSAGVEDTAHYDGKVYGFCSAECKETFLKDPQKYLAKK
jgi:YHS domain-containing protein